MGLLLLLLLLRCSRSDLGSLRDTETHAGRCYTETKAKNGLLLLLLLLLRYEHDCSNGSSNKNTQPCGARPKETPVACCCCSLGSRSKCF